MTTKNELFEKIEAQKEKLWEMADFIFDMRLPSVQSGNMGKAVL